LQLADAAPLAPQLVNLEELVTQAVAGRGLREDAAIRRKPCAVIPSMWTRINGRPSRIVAVGGRRTTAFPRSRNDAHPANRIFARMPRPVKRMRPGNRTAAGQPQRTLYGRQKLSKPRQDRTSGRGSPFGNRTLHSEKMRAVLARQTAESSRR